MNKTWLFGILIAIFLGLVAFGYIRTQTKSADTGKTYRIGILVRGSGYDPAVAGFKKRMDELGYHDGKNITYDVQFITDKNQLAVVTRTFI